MAYDSYHQKIQNARTSQEAIAAVVEARRYLKKDVDPQWVYMAVAKLDNENIPADDKLIAAKGFMTAAEFREYARERIGPVVQQYLPQIVDPLVSPLQVKKKIVGPNNRLKEQWSLVAETMIEKAVETCWKENGGNAGWLISRPEDYKRVNNVLDQLYTDVESKNDEWFSKMQSRVYAAARQGLLIKMGFTKDPGVLRGFSGALPELFSDPIVRRFYHDRMVQLNQAAPVGQYEEPAEYYTGLSRAYGYLPQVKRIGEFLERIRNSGSYPELTHVFKRMPDSVKSDERIRTALMTKKNELQGNQQR